MQARWIRVLVIGIAAGTVGLVPADCQQPPAAVQPHNPQVVTASRPAVPAAQYSPLAAQGGYKGQRTTWYEAMFRSLNPKNIDWGMRWEQRRSIFLENSIGNKYFVYTAALSLLLIYLTVVIVWQRWDHTERLKALAQSTADVLNYATYWKQAAGEANCGGGSPSSRSSA